MRRRTRTAIRRNEPDKRGSLAPSTGVTYVRQSPPSLADEFAWLCTSTPQPGPGSRWPCSGPSRAEPRHGLAVRRLARPPGAQPLRRAARPAAHRPGPRRVDRRRRGRGRAGADRRAAARPQMGPCRPAGRLRRLQAGPHAPPALGRDAGRLPRPDRLVVPDGLGPRRGPDAGPRPAAPAPRAPGAASPPRPCHDRRRWPPCPPTARC